MTTEQRELFAEVFSVKPSDTQTPEQALAVEVSAFQYACAFEGIEIPTEAEIRAEVAA